MKKFDVAVIGGGPAGIMSAIVASEKGAKVAIIEKNSSLGKKLLLTGGGRCNFTNAEYDLRQLVQKYEDNGKFLFHAFSVFGPKQVIEFFTKLKVEIKIEKGKRVFPVSDNAIDILNALINKLWENNVEIVYDAEVIDIQKKNNTIINIKTVINKKETIITAKKYIICTGGKSYAKTGSTGKCFPLIKKLGHRIESLSPALSPIKTKETWIKEWQGIGLEDVSICIKSKKTTQQGDILFAHFGLSGPVSLNISNKIRKLLTKEKETIINIDLMPAHNIYQLTEKIRKCLQNNKSKTIKNSLDCILPQRVIISILELVNIDKDKRSNDIKKEEVHILTKTIKNISLTAIGVMGFSNAMVTSGGVAVNEIDDKTMKSKIINNLFFAGEVIDVSGSTGGFNLQGCFSTGYLAGLSAKAGTL